MFDMSETMYERLMKLPKDRVLNILWAALDEMEGYNGQSKTSAVMRAIGAETNNEETSWKWPSHKKLLDEWKI